MCSVLHVCCNYIADIQVRFFPRWWFFIRSSDRAGDHFDRPEGWRRRFVHVGNGDEVGEMTHVFEGRVGLGDWDFKSWRIGVSRET